MAKLLMIVPSARTIRVADGSDHLAGYRAEEVRKPYEALTGACVDVAIATPDGQVPQPDPWGLPGPCRWKARPTKNRGSSCRSWVITAKP